MTWRLWDTCKRSQKFSPRLVKIFQSVRPALQARIKYCRALLESTHSPCRNSLGAHCDQTAHQRRIFWRAFSNFIRLNVIFCELAKFPETSDPCSFAKYPQRSAWRGQNNQSCDEKRLYTHLFTQIWSQYESATDTFHANAVPSAFRSSANSFEPSCTPRILNWLFNSLIYHTSSHLTNFVNDRKPPSSCIFPSLPSSWWFLNWFQDLRFHSLTLIHWPVNLSINTIMVYPVSPIARQLRRLSGLVFRHNERIWNDFSRFQAESVAIMSIKETCVHFWNKFAL